MKILRAKKQSFVANTGNSAMLIIFLKQALKEKYFHQSQVFTGLHIMNRESVLLADRLCPFFYYKLSTFPLK
jgi:predicted XRE-type DNA-binding protein